MLLLGWGWENAFSCEINEFCQRVLKYHYPNSKHYENIFGTNFAEWRGKIDVLTAGFPCQPFSVAGERKGAEDDRYLWPEVLRVINEVRPTWFIGENVSGIRSVVLPGEEVEVGSYTDILGESYTFTEKHERYVLDRICEDLESIGYSIQPVTIPACAVGAPHRRDRIWFIAYRSNTGIEDVQQERKDRILPIKSTPYADGKRCNNRSDYWEKRQFCLDKERYSKKNKSERNKWKCRIGKNGETFTNTHKFNGDISRFCASEFSQHESSRVLKNTSDSPGKRLQGKMSRYAIMPAEPFRNFPSQSPVCCGDDGFPSGLSGITVSKHRQESIKAYGNTMVPQVVFEIFKAINEIETHEQEK